MLRGRHGAGAHKGRRSAARRPQPRAQSGGRPGDQHYAHYTRQAQVARFASGRTSRGTTRRTTRGTTRGTTKGAGRPAVRGRVGCEAAPQRALELNPNEKKNASAHSCAHMQTHRNKTESTAHCHRTDSAMRCAQWRLVLSRGTSHHTWTSHTRARLGGVVV